MKIIKSSDLAKRFGELAQLESGWHDGQGKAPRRAKFDIFAQKMTELYPGHIPLPSIVPTQDGNLLLEWRTIGDPSVDIDLDTMQASYHAFGENGEDLEKVLPLITDKDYTVFFDFLSERIKLETACNQSPCSSDKFTPTFY